MTDICVHGLGYIGLPTATMFANAGYDVIGFDVDKGVVDTLRNGEVHIDEPGLEALVDEVVGSGHLSVATDVPTAEVHIVCVPTPFDEAEKTADLHHVEAAGAAVSDVLRKGDTVVLESTVPPGTTRDVLQPTLEARGMDAGDDFSLVYCPETVLPGNIITELRENSRVIGGVDSASTRSVIDLYRSFVTGEIFTTEDTTTAEFVKLIQNTYRDTNIALANEISTLAHDYDIDSRQAIRLANEHPRVDIHHPGPGVGGHCLPIDPWFLGYASDRLNLIQTARAVNEQMSEYVVELLTAAVGELDGIKIAVFGIAYKGDVDDTRMSPGLEVADAIQNSSNLTATAADGGVAPDVEVAIHDPNVSDQRLDLASFGDALDGADALVVTTDHTAFASVDPSTVRELMSGRTVVDTKAILPTTTWEEEGLDVVTL